MARISLKYELILFKYTIFHDFGHYFRPPSAAFRNFQQLLPSAKITAQLNGLHFYLGPVWSSRQRKSMPFHMTVICYIAVVGGTLFFAIEFVMN